MPSAEQASAKHTERVVHEVAHAKVNLALDVLGRRADGYHDLRSVMQTVSLHDDLSFSRDPTFAHPHPPETDFSLIDRAIELVRRDAGFSGDVYYRLTKRIPVSAGLGGGSSDAMAALRGTARLLDERVGTARLAEMAASLGCDVPFFLTGGTATVEGRGERVTPLDAMPQRWFLLVNMDVPVSTGSVFAAWKAGPRGDGHATDRVLARLRAGDVTLGGNDLTAAATVLSPAIVEAIDLLSGVAATERIAMSGSGGTVFALFPSEEEARAAEREVMDGAPWTCVASSCAGAGTP